MAKKTASIEVEKDYLVKSKEFFKEELGKAILRGEALLVDEKRNSSISEDEIDEWERYNYELIKSSFNNPDSVYLYEYCRYSITGSLDSRINDQISTLKKFISIIPLLQVDPKIENNFKLTNNQTSLCKLENLLNRFHKIAQALRKRHSSRNTLTIADEYDVQDLLNALLSEHFDDIRPEDYVPSYAGSNSRVDFVLKKEKIIIETKMTNDSLKDKEIGTQLLIDIARYENHPDCEVLVLFVYDRGDYILNKAALIDDLNKKSTTSLTIRTIIVPQ